MAVEAFLIDEDAIVDLARRAVLAVLKAVLESMMKALKRRLGVCEGVFVSGAVGFL